MIRTIKYIRFVLLAAVVLSCGTVFTACQDDIEVSKFDDGDYGKIADVYCSLRNSAGPIAKTFELRDQALEASYYIDFSKPAETGVDLTVKIAPSVLEAYNAQNNTAFEIFPANLATLSEEGVLVVAPGERRSDPVTVTLTPDESLKQGMTYALPLSVEAKTPGIKLAEGAADRVLFIKTMAAIPSTAKSTGIVSIAYVECNSNNPLNVGEWHLAKSGKPLFDIVNLFAANINYIEAEGRIGVVLNPNILRMLENRDVYIKPLQEMGIKVCLTILGNHDGTGVANLSENTAREFAAELKAIVDTYGLDGVDFDDEWSDYSKYPIRPGCVTRNGAAYSRLCYEVKRAMPDKLCMVYYVGAVIPDPSVGSYGFNEMIGGMCPGDYVDYSYFAQYGAISTSYTTILGMTKMQWGASSIDVGSSPNIYNLDYVRKNGYGVQVIYDVTAIANNPSDPRYRNHKNTFDAIAKKLYDDTGVVWSGINHY